MKIAWKIEKLSNVFQIKPPKSEVKNRLKNDDLVSFLPMEDLGILTKDFKAPKERYLKEVSGSYTYFSDNDVLLAKITPCFENGKMGVAKNLINGVGFGSSEYIVFRPNGKVIADYLFYFLSIDEFRDEGKKQMSGAVGHKRVSNDFVENYLITFPESLTEQQNIVAALEKLFALITKTKDNFEKNILNAREFFESYLQDTFTNPGNKWQCVRIDSVCESIIDCINKTAPKTNEPTPFKMIRTTNVRNGLINLDSVNYVTEEVYRAWTRRQTPKEGDIILTREAPMGEVGMLTGNESVFLGQRLVSYRANPEKINNKFLLYAFQSRHIQSQIKALASGSTVQHMRVPDSKALKLYLPSLREQNNLVKSLDIFSAETIKIEEIYQKKLALLENLKKSILKKAFNWELKEHSATNINTKVNA